MMLVLYHLFALSKIGNETILDVNKSTQTWNQHVSIHWWSRLGSSQSRQDCQQTQQTVNGLWETMGVTKYRWRNGIRKFDECRDQWLPCSDYFGSVLGTPHVSTPSVVLKFGSARAPPLRWSPHSDGTERPRPRLAHICASRTLLNPRHKIVFCSLQSSHFPQNCKLSHDTSATILEWNLTELKSIKYAKFQNKWWQV
jgi:hypothetical protein